MSTNTIYNNIPLTLLYNFSSMLRWQTLPLLTHWTCGDVGSLFDVFRLTTLLFKTQTAVAKRVCCQATKTHHPMHPDLQTNNRVVENDDNYYF